MKINFTKMQGLGNDFVVLDYDEFLKTGKTPSDLALKLCDRKFSIGADGLIIVNSEVKDTDIGWIFYNSDGTMAQMCGNGMRCFAKYVTDKGIINKKQFSVKTEAGVICPEILDNGEIRVNMNLPILEPSKIPFTEEKNLDYKLNVKDKVFSINAVSMGNPHCIIYTDGDTMELAKKYGTEVIGEIPIEIAIREGGDKGKPISFYEPNSVSSKRYEYAARALISALEKIERENLADNSAIQPQM